jgi:hypothetical protein
MCERRFGAPRGDYEPDLSTLPSFASALAGAPPVRAAVQHPAEALRPRVDPSGHAVPDTSGASVTAPPAAPDLVPVAIRSLTSSGEVKNTTGTVEWDKF